VLRIVCTSGLIWVGLWIVGSPSTVDAKTPVESPESLSGTGVIVARHVVDLAPRIEGSLKEVHAQIGDTVRAGAVIAVLDTVLIRNELRLARALLMEALADTERVVSEVRLAEYQFSACKGIADSAGPKAIGEVRMRELGRNAAKARADLAMVRARIEQQTARVRQLEDELDMTAITAPYDAVVAKCYRDQGSMVDPDKAILRLISTELLARFAVDEADASSIEVGSVVVIVVGTVGSELTGSVERIAPEVDIASGMVVVEARITDWKGQRGEIKSGTEVHVRY
jgi:multidrug efflux pump subunit AcrA (membrane-fusion protein)